MTETPMCPNGHPKTPENTYRKPTTGKPSCRPCRLERGAEARRNKSADKPPPKQAPSTMLDRHGNFTVDRAIDHVVAEHPQLTDEEVALHAAELAPARIRAAVIAGLIREQVRDAREVAG